MPDLYPVPDAAQAKVTYKAYGHRYRWLPGRVGDMIGVLRRRIGAAEVESAPVTHATVADAAAVDDLMASRASGRGATSAPRRSATTIWDEWAKSRLPYSF